MQKIVECVPNFSNGRSPEIYNAIADSIRGVSGAHVLDVSADADHNRTVITFVGEPQAVEEAAFRAIGKAAELIDMDTQTGEHPRIGATDVCPFIPVKGVTVADCVAIAERLGKRVGEELGVAVYLYGSAATSPARKKLSAIRRGQYELWKSEVATNPARLPDFGPATPQKWGATVIGARPFLVAYNIYLNSDKVEVAEKIAKVVRFTSGGFRFVQAKGFLVEGQAQVSMNLTNFKKTAVHHVQETVRREAARYGLSITHAELVGLIPQDALVDAARYYLQLDEMGDDQILEYRLAESAAASTGSASATPSRSLSLSKAEADITPAAFLDATASKSSTPGGGSAAALAGALAVALTQMVAGLTVGRKKYAGVEEEITAVLSQANALRETLTAAIAEDAASFEQLMAVWRDKSLTGVDREAAIEKATIHTGEVPLKVARLSRDAAQLGLKMATIGNVNAVTDAAAAVMMAQAAVLAAGLNVKINGVGLQDRDLAAAWTVEVDELAAGMADLVMRVTAIAAERGGF